MEEVSSVRLLKPDGSSIEGRFIRWEENPDDPDSVRLILEFEGAQLIADAEGFFDAMIAIRRELEYKLDPALRSGGCAFGLDHRIPNGTPIENYRYYVALGREMLGLPPLDPTRLGWARMAM